MFTVSLLFVYFSLLGYLLLIGILYYNGIRIYSPVENGKHLKHIFVLFTLLGIYGAFTGDYPHFGQILHNLQYNRRYMTHMETIYVDIAKYVDYNYTLFRVSISILSYSLLYWILKINNCLDYRVLFFYAIFELQYAIEGRQQCSIYMFYLGVYLLLIRKHFLTGISLMALSLIFHKSGITALAILPFLVFKFNKRNLWLSIIMFPFIVYIENSLLNSYLSESDIELAGSNYFTASDFSRTITMKIVYVMRILLQYSIAIWLLRKTSWKRSKTGRISAKLLYGAMYITSALFFLNIDQLTPFDRSLRLWWIPMFVILAQTLHTHFKRNRFLIKTSFLYIIFSIGYALLVYRYQPNCYV